MLRTYVLKTCMLAVSVGIAFASGYWSTQPGGTAPATAEAAGIYACPMHPQYTSTHAGDCAVCGMRLVAKTATGHAHDAATPGDRPSVQLPARTQQLAGLRVTAVERSSATQILRLVARVTPEETRTYTVTAGTDGVVGDVSVVTTGTRVREGEYLAMVSAPDAFPAIQNFLIALDVIDRLADTTEDGQAQALTTSTSVNFQQRIAKLHDIGMSDAQIGEMRRSREVPSGIRVTAPAAGTVLMRNIFAGQRFERGTEWYRIADLRSVWLEAEIVGAEAAHIEPGLVAHITVPGQTERLDAHVSESLPQFDGERRTLKVRLEADNPARLLRPNMLVNVDLPIRMPPGIVVPVDAVVDSGLRKVVFVEGSDGVLTPRDVETGWRFNDRVQIVSGLEPGERIITAGTFLVDAESRMSGIVARFGAGHGRPAVTSPDAPPVAKR